MKNKECMWQSEPHWNSTGPAEAAPNAFFRLDYKSIKSEVKNPSLNPDRRLKPLARVPHSLQCQSMPWGSVPPYANVLLLLSIKIWSLFWLIAFPSTSKERLKCAQATLKPPRQQARQPPVPTVLCDVSLSCSLPIWRLD